MKNGKGYGGPMTAKGAGAPKGGKPKMMPPKPKGKAKAKK